jgi:hypothetical protein
MKPNWFNSLQEALMSESLVEYWPLGVNIQYNQTIKVVAFGKYISVYRNENGLYERPIHYKTKREI